jgi:hypothetical protein
MTHAQFAVGNYFAVGLEWFAVCLVLPCALYLQMTHAQFVVGSYFVVGQECFAVCFDMSCVLHYAVRFVYAVCRDTAKTQSRLPASHPSSTV